MNSNLPLASLILVLRCRYSFQISQAGPSLRLIQKHSLRAHLPTWKFLERAQKLSILQGDSIGCLSASQNPIVLFTDADSVLVQLPQSIVPGTVKLCYATPTSDHSSDGSFSEQGLSLTAIIPLVNFAFGNYEQSSTIELSIFGASVGDRIYVTNADRGVQQLTPEGLPIREVGQQDCPALNYGMTDTFPPYPCSSRRQICSKETVRGRYATFRSQPIHGESFLPSCERPESPPLLFLRCTDLRSAYSISSHGDVVLIVDHEASALRKLASTLNDDGGEHEAEKPSD